MELQELELVVIQCIKENLTLSGEVVPQITKHTKPALDLRGFDSLRTLEVIISLEEKLACDLPADKIFSGQNFEDVTVSSIAAAILKVKKDAKQ